MEAQAASGGGGKLTAAVRLALWHGKWDRTCAMCERWAFGDDGLVRKDGDGKPMLRRGLPTPCHKCPKVPEEARVQGLPRWRLRALAEEATEPNRAAMRAYQRYKAIGSFPADELVAWYSGLIREAEDAYERSKLDGNGAKLDAVFDLMLLRFQSGR